MKKKKKKVFLCGLDFAFQVLCLKMNILFAHRGPFFMHVISTYQRLHNTLNNFSAKTYSIRNSMNLIKFKKAVKICFCGCALKIPRSTTNKNRCNSCPGFMLYIKWFVYYGLSRFFSSTLNSLYKNILHDDDDFFFAFSLCETTRISHAKFNAIRQEYDF